MWLTNVNEIWYMVLQYIIIDDKKGRKYSHPGLHVWALTSTVRTPGHTPFGELSKH